MEFQALLDWNCLLMAIQRIQGYDRLLFHWWWVGAAVIVLMVLLALWRLMVLAVLWWRTPTARPTKLWHQLLRVHRLNSEERAMLNKLVQRLPKGVHAAVLFVDPTAWVWNASDDSRLQESLKKLYTKIFGFPPESLGN